MSKTHIFTIGNLCKGNFCELIEREAESIDSIDYVAPD